MPSGHPGLRASTDPTGDPLVTSGSSVNANVNICAYGDSSLPLGSALVTSALSDNTAVQNVHNCRIVPSNGLAFFVDTGRPAVDSVYSHDPNLPVEPNLQDLNATPNAVPDFTPITFDSAPESPTQVAIRLSKRTFGKDILLHDCDPKRSRH